MSHYKPYPAYKDSGVEWLGRVPEHWSIVPLKWCFECLDGKRVPLNSEQRADIKGEVPYWGSGGVVDHIEKFIFDESLVLLGEDGAPFFDRDRPVAYAIQGKSWINNHIHVLRPLTDYPITWFVHALNCVEYRHYIDGSTRDKLTQDDMKSIALVIPKSPDEARKAVAHLDRETARIDALIEKKTRFIELLREKRQALITHAVTKGLDPSVKMKGSGVEWLGEVPEHWEALPLRRVVTAVKTGGTPTEEQPSPDADGLAWYTPGDFGNSLVLSSSEKRVSALVVSTGEAKVYPAGAVLVVSIGATLGKVGYLVESASANQQINAVIPNSRVNGYFLAYSLSVKTEAMWFLANAATIGIMNQEKTKEIWLAVPPPSEQKAITNSLDKGTRRLDSLIGKTERSIELLKERRSALITAAVTGQIDLREAV